MKNELWLCGKLVGKWNKAGSVWEFQGIFETREEAVKACKTSKYFIYPVKVGESLPEKASFPEYWEYPRANKTLRCIDNDGPCSSEHVKMTGKNCEGCGG